MQGADNLRHAQEVTHAVSVYNKYFNGLHSANHWFDNVWYLSVPKSFFEDAVTAGPFEFLTAVSFSFEYVLTNLLFVPFMSGAAHNGDLSTVTFGFSAQSDESRHMTLGIECIKFMLEQDPQNVPIVQRWMDKWFWRGYRLLTIVAMMQDYMLPKRVMSWAEAWEIYFEQNGGALFADLARYGVRMPLGWETTVKEKGHVSHQVWCTLYQFRHAAGFPVWLPSAEEMDWMSAKYPETFDKYYRPRYEHWAELERQGKPFGLVFDDIARFNDRDMQVIVRELKTEVMARALHNAPPEVVQKFFSNMSVGAASLLTIAFLLVLGPLAAAIAAPMRPGVMTSSVHS